jgi:hypothetical protein
MKSDKPAADFAFTPTAPAGNRFTEPEPSPIEAELEAAKRRAIRQLFGGPIDLIAVARQQAMTKVKS